MKNDLEMIKDYHDSLTGPSVKASTRAWNRLAAEVEAAPFAGPARPPGRGLRRLAFRAGVVVTLVSAVSVGVVVVGAGDNSSPLSVRPANAAELLQYAAAASLKDPSPRPDQFIYQDRKDVQYYFGGGSSGRFDGRRDIRREFWVPAGSAGEALTRSTFEKDVLLHGKRFKGMIPEGTVKYFRGEQCPDTAPLYRDAAAYATDPAALMAKVRQDAEKEVRDPSFTDDPEPLTAEQIPLMVDGVVVYKLLSLAQSPFATPEIRATVFRALSTTPSVTVNYDLADPAGRRGIGTEITWTGLEGKERAELVFEPETFKFLGWRSFQDLKQIDGSVEETLLMSTALMSTTIVDSTPEVPAGEDGEGPC